MPGRPSTLIGIPFDRPVVGYGGKTINTLRLWAASTPDYFDFAQFSSGDFVGALTETLTAGTLTRVLYPDDHTIAGKGLRFLQEYFLVACSLADLIRRFRAAGNDCLALPEKAAIQLNDTHPTKAVPELMRLWVDEAKLGWEEAWHLTRKSGRWNHALLIEPRTSYFNHWGSPCGSLKKPGGGTGVTQIALLNPLPNHLGAVILAPKGGTERPKLLRISGLVALFDFSPVQ